MGPGGFGGFGGFCLALLCSGAALGARGAEPGSGNVPEATPEATAQPPGPPGPPSAASGGGDAVTAGPSATTAPPGSGDGAATAAGNGTGVTPAVPARYWSPVLFVALALLVLFVTYRRTKDKGIRDRATSGSDSSDLGALVQPPTPKFPALQGEGEDPGAAPGPERAASAWSQAEPSRATLDSPPGGS